MSEATGREALESERDFLLSSLGDLDTELEAGDMEHSDYLALKEGYTARAGEVLRALERLDDPDQPAHPDHPGGERAVRTVERGLPEGGQRARARWRGPAIAAGVAAFAVVSGLLVASQSGQRLPGETTSGQVTPIGPEQQLAQAQNDLSNGRYLDAIKTFDAVIRQDPGNAEALAYRGWILRLTGDASNDPSLVASGLASIRLAEKVDPGYPDAHFFAGEILLRDEGDGPAAAAEFRQVFADKPDPSLVPEIQGELEAALAAPPASTTTTAP